MAGKNGMPERAKNMSFPTTRPFGRPPRSRRRHGRFVGRFLAGSSLPAEPLSAIVRMSLDGHVDIEGMKGGYFCGADPEALGFRTLDKQGRKADPNLLSASFSL